MRYLRAWLHRLAGLMRRNARERELQAELESHFQLHIDDNLRAGMTPEEARRAAVLKFGPVEAIKEDYRDRGGIPFIEAILQDLRYALRRWIRRPGFAIAATLTLALGIGATTAVFSTVDAVLLKPLPWPEADRLVTIRAMLPDRRGDPAYAQTWNRQRLSWSEWRAIEGSRAFERVGVWSDEQDFWTLGDDRPVMIGIAHASGSYLSLIGAQPSLGRLFTDTEDTTESSVAILTHDAWVRHFGARRDIIGESVRLRVRTESQPPVTIVGVLGPEVRFPGRAPDIVLPSGRRAYVGQYGHALFEILALLAPGTSPDAARVAIEPLVHVAPSAYRRSARIESLRDDRTGHAALPLWIMLSGAVVLLLVACTNVAGLLVGEARVRRHEVAVRIALGANRARILRQWTVEHLLLALCGGASGILLAVWLTPALAALAPDRLPGIEAVGISQRVVTVAILSAAATALLFGIGPALTLWSGRLTAVLGEGGRDLTPRAPSVHRAFVAVQLGLALVLLVGAALLGETMFRLTTRPVGFDPAGVAVVSIVLTHEPGLTSGGSQISAAEYMALPLVERQARTQRMREAYTTARLASWTHTAALIERLTALPGTASAAAAQAAPFSRAPAMVGVVRPPDRPESDAQRVERQTVSEQYFTTLGVPLLRGRTFTPSDRQSHTAAVISRELERRFFGDAGVGGRLVIGDAVYEVVGVVANVRQRTLGEEDLATVYVLDRTAQSVNRILVRTAGDPLSALPLIRQTIQDHDPRMVVTSTSTMEALLAESVAEERYRATLATAFGFAALVLAAVGLYGLASRQVAERRREIAVRVALGAAPGDIRSLVFRDGLAIVSLGLLVGLPAAYAASQTTQSFLFGVTSTAPHVFALAAGVLSLTALCAMLLPAIRASRTDPTEVLRE